MKDEEKSREQLLKELIELRKQIVANNIEHRLREEFKKAKESEETYRGIFQNSNDAIFFHDLNGKIIDLNQRFVDLFGYDRTELSSTRMVDLVDRDDQEKYLSAL
ncbi:MAG: PAS domain S-box protein, partial [bacterium]